MLSEVPLKRGSDVEALCGRTVHGAQWVFEEVIAGDIKSLAQMTIRTCPKCKGAYEAMDPEEFAKLGYVYGTLPAVEMKLVDWAEAS